jgi:hypothetical protein
LNTLQDLQERVPQHKDRISDVHAKLELWGVGLFDDPATNFEVVLFNWGARHSELGKLILEQLLELGVTIGKVPA